MRVVILPEHLRQVVVPIHRAGWPFIAAGVVAAVLLGLLFAPLFWLGLLVTAWMVYFFRDPPRVAPQGDDLAVSPADGVVQAITARRPPPELGLGDTPRTCISIFLNIFDVHMNRAPIGRCSYFRSSAASGVPTPGRAGSVKWYRGHRIGIPPPAK
jgi:phosphatidylserine decarboxylase